MPDVKFIIGLTDEESEFFFYDKNTPEGITTYNLYKLMPEIEKTTIEWKLRTNLDAFSGAYDAFGKIIRRPHLNMVNIRRMPNRYAPDEFDIHLGLDFVNLIPVIAEEFYKEMSDTDFDELTLGSRFGNLTVQYMDSLVMRDDDFLRENTFQAAYNTNSLTYLKHADEYRPLIAPNFRACFDLGNVNIPSKDMPKYHADWIKENEDELSKKGYVIGSPKTRMGELVIGDLVGDPWDAYQKLKMYDKICRISFYTEPE